MLFQLEQMSWESCNIWGDELKNETPGILFLRQTKFISKIDLTSQVTFSWVANSSSMHVACLMWSYLMGTLWPSSPKCAHEASEREILLSVKFSRDSRKTFYIFFNYITIFTKCKQMLVPFETPSAPTFCKYGW